LVHRKRVPGGEIKDKPLRGEEEVRLPSFQKGLQKGKREVLGRVH